MKRKVYLRLISHSNLHTTCTIKLNTKTWGQAGICTRDSNNYSNNNVCPLCASPVHRVQYISNTCSVFNDCLDMKVKPKNILRSLVIKIQSLIQLYVCQLIKNIQNIIVIIILRLYAPDFLLILAIKKNNKKIKTIL